MKRNLQTIIGASAASVLGFSALPQDASSPPLNRPDYTHAGQTHERRADRLNGAAKVSEIIGMTVNNYQDQKLGKVEDLAVDVESGRIVQVILSSGGFIGIGDTLTAVPPGALHHDSAQKVLHLDADQQKLKDAPKFAMSKWAEHSDSDHLSAVYRYYGEEPAFTFIHQGAGRRDGQRNAEGSPKPISTPKAEGTWDQDRVSSQDQSLIPASRLAQVQRASKLLGLPVKNRQNETLGEVENILVDLPSGRLVAVVVSSGGFLGIGDALSAVPPTVLQFTPERDSLQLDTSKEKLSSAPYFRSNQWPDFAQPSYASGVYHAYQVEPYFGTNVTTGADNTVRNVRDRDNRTLTPLDQGNSQADVDTTAAIRKEVIADNSLSVNAQNVKIITHKGQVTLRGPVNTAEEKRLIGEIADRIARPGNVDNQLEVTLTTTSNN